MYIICAKYRTCKYTPKIFRLLCLIKFKKLQADGLQSTSVEYRVMLSLHRSRKRTQSIVKQLNCFCVIVKFVRTFPICVNKGTKSECAKEKSKFSMLYFLQNMFGRGNKGIYTACFIRTQTAISRNLEVNIQIKDITI